MKKLLSLKTLLICISFTVFLLLVKDNMDVVWSAIGWITGIITPFAIGFLFAYILNYPYKFFYSKVFGTCTFADVIRLIKHFFTAEK